MILIMATTNLLEVLQKAGLRATPQRAAICELLARSKDHPTANDIYSVLKTKYPSLSLATVYNTLDVLVGMGLVNALGSIGDDRVHFDANLSPHINLVCTNCHKVMDAESDCVTDLDAELSRKSGYRLEESRILYFGICPECQKQLNN